MKVDKAKTIPIMFFRIVQRKQEEVSWSLRSNVPCPDGALDV
jgi:hypothetical protein